MVQRGSGSRFQPKAFESLWVFGEFFGKKFQSNSATKFGIFRLVNDTHSAAAESFENSVMRDGLSDKRLGIRHLAVILGRGPEGCQRLSGRMSGRRFPTVRGRLHLREKVH